MRFALVLAFAALMLGTGCQGAPLVSAEPEAVAEVQVASADEKPVRKTMFDSLLDTGENKTRFSPFELDMDSVTKLMEEDRKRREDGAAMGPGRVRIGIAWGRCP